MEYKSDIVKKLRENEMEGYCYDESSNSVINMSNNLSIDIDSFVDEYLKSTGQSFKCIRDSDIFCWSLIECTECGTVVRCYDDEFYDPNFKCPICTGYNTYFKYWTKKEIEKSFELSLMMNYYEETAKEEAKVKSKGEL